MIERVFGLLVLTCLHRPPPAWHGDTESQAHLALRGRGSLTLEVDTDRMMQAIAQERPDGFPWTVVEIADHEVAILEHLQQHYRLRRDEASLPLEPVRVDPLLGLDPLFGVERIHRLLAHYRLPPQAGDFTLQVEHDLFADLEIAHRHVLHFEEPDAVTEPVSVVLTSLPTPFRVEDPSAAGARARLLHWAGRGIRETGWWLAALFVVALLAVRLRDSSAAAPVAAFHPAIVFVLFLPLCAWIGAKLDLDPAPWAVRITSALSICYVAGENLFARDLGLRLATAALFSVVHGLHLLDRYGTNPDLPRLQDTMCAGSYAVGASMALLALLPAAIVALRVGAAHARAAFRVAVHGGLLLAALGSVLWTLW